MCSDTLVVKKCWIVLIRAHSTYQNCVIIYLGVFSDDTVLVQVGVVVSHLESFHVIFQDILEVYIVLHSSLPSLSRRLHYSLCLRYILTRTLITVISNIQHPTLYGSLVKDDGVLYIVSTIGHNSHNYVLTIWMLIIGEIFVVTRTH